MIAAVPLGLRLLCIGFAAITGVKGILFDWATSQANGHGTARWRRLRHMSQMLRRVRVFLSVVLLLAIAISGSITVPLILFTLTAIAIIAGIPIALATGLEERRARRAGQWEEQRSGSSRGSAYDERPATILDNTVPKWPTPVAIVSAGRRRRQQFGDALTVIRLIWLGMVFSSIAYVAAAATIEPWKGARDAGIPTIVIVGMSLPILGGVAWSQRRPLDTSSSAALVTSYRSLFFLGVGLSMSIGLLAFASVFVIGSSRVYLAGLVPTLIGLWMISPTRGHLERRDEEIRSGGSPLSLRASLSMPLQPELPQDTLE